jgi:hypothetical protein
VKQGGDRAVFNLLVKYAEWGAGRDTVEIDRLFEHTDRSVSSSFKEGETVLLDELARLPCLFMREGVNDELAHVGSITRARLAGRQIVLEYAYDTSIPPLLNRVIHANRLDFDITNDFEFSRTHWAVKDVDLYRILLRCQTTPLRQRPRVFQLPEPERIDPTLVSVMMPFDPALTPVYDTLRETAERFGLQCRRADNFWEHPAIIQDIVTLIDRSRVVICDCSQRNANVFYEIGIAHTLGREVILITQNAADVPFDLGHLRYVPYLNNAEGRRALGEALANRFLTLLNS